MHGFYRATPQRCTPFVRICIPASLQAFGRKISVIPSAAIFIYALEPCSIFGIIFCVYRIENVIVRGFRVEINAVKVVTVKLRITVGGSALPDNLVSEIVFTKNLVHQDLHIMPNVIVQMHIDRCRFTHDTFDRHEVFVHPAQVLFFIPDIAVHLFLKGFQLVHIQLPLRLRNGLGNLGIAADIDLFGVVRAAGKGRVDVDQIDLNALLFQIGAGRHAFAANDHVATGVLAHGLLLLHLVQGHSPLERHGQFVRALVAQNAVEISQHRLLLHGFGNEGDVFNGHYPCPPFSMWCMNCSSDVAIPMEAKHSRASC